MAKPQKDPPTAVTNPNGWDAHHGTYIAGRAALDGVDALAIEMEAKWGCGRLRLLVDAGLRERFDRQRYKLNSAILHGDLEAVRSEANRMISAWKALDFEATAVGAMKLNPEVWEVPLSTGKVAAIVKDTAAAHKVVADGRDLLVFTLEEVARLIEAHNAVVAAKVQWPGATVEAVRKSIPDPLDAIRYAGSLDDPLDDLFHPSA